MRRQRVICSGFGVLLLLLPVSVLHARTGENSSLPGGSYDASSFHHSLGEPAESAGPPRLTIEHMTFTCHEGECGHYYNHCDLQIHYHARLDESAVLPASTRTSCRASIEYRTSSGDVLMTEGELETVHRTFVSGPEDAGRIGLDFLFSYYEAVVDAHVSRVECRIDNAELYSAVK